MIGKERLKSGGIRFSKFTIVGAINASVDIATLNILIMIFHTREPSVLALYNGVALVLANLNSYVWNSLWTFRGRAEHDLYQTVTFAAQALVNIAISNLLFLSLVRPILNNSEVSAYLAGNIAKVVSVAVSSVVSFFLMRYLVFSSKKPLSPPRRPPGNGE